MMGKIFLWYPSEAHFIINFMSSPGAIDLNDILENEIKKS
jgi:hypothetical protein